MFENGVRAFDIPACVVRTIMIVPAPSVSIVAVKKQIDNIIPKFQANFI